ncbi:MHS family MFS transporter [Metallosphaera tengchongensis]|uniref:MHS family MFS transporter n=1 Tax=Metallosphaera tengchongensis TaxID=1532350 RepID=A0A6N0NUA1_9CREN|nr:MFS transporter [Metallosphaera tengchongensis]QKQ99047.1 MHS family MFS transporter [Metallosphaera tengchongensis]
MNKYIPAIAFLTTLLSWYSFFSLGFLSALYFPRYLSIVGSALLYFTSFVCRPLGAFVLGKVADKRGRSVSVISVLSLIAVGDGLLSAGTPILAVPSTLMIGLALGGGWSSSSVLLAEAVRTLRGTWTSLVQLSVPFGLILALTVSLSPRLMLIPSLTSASLIAISFKIPDTRGVKLGMELSGVKGLVKGIMVKAGESSNFYLFTSFSLPLILEAGLRVGVLPVLAMAIEETFLMVPMGALSDIKGRRQIIRAGMMVMFSSAVLLSLSLILRWNYLVYASFLMFGIGDSLAYAPQGAYLAELYDPKHRVTMTGLAYQLSALFSGGTSVVLASLLLSRGEYAILALPLISLFYVTLSIISV